MAVLASACSADQSAAPSQAPAEEQVLHYGISDDPGQLRAGSNQTNSGYLVDSLIHRGLLKYDAEGSLTAALAESYTVVDNATYEFTLREGLAFSDGSPLTADNVKNSLLYYATPESGSRTAQGMRNIDAIDVQDDRHLTINLKSGDPAFLDFLANPTAFIASDEELDPEAEAPLATGPFMIDSEKAGVSLTLVKNPSYYDAENVKLDEIELIFYASGTARANALISGQVDLMNLIDYQDYDRLSNTSGLVLDNQDAPMMQLEFNTTQTPLDDPKVRQAIAYAINRDSVVSAAFSGFASPLNGFPIAGSEDVSEDVAGELWEYDPEKAEDLLAEAGYPDGFSTTILSTSSYTFYQDTALIVQSDLAEIGITTTIETPDWATRNEDSAAGNYGLKISGYSGVVPGPTYIEAYLGGAESGRSFGYENEELMAALLSGRADQDEQVRKDSYVEAFEIIASDVPSVPLVQRGQAYAYTERLQDYTNLPGFLSALQSGYTLEDAYLTAGR